MVPELLSCTPCKTTLQLEDSAYGQIILPLALELLTFPNLHRSASVPPLLSVSYFIHLWYRLFYTIIFSQGMTCLFILLTVSFSGQKFLILKNLILTDNLILNNLILIKSNLFFIHGICFWRCSWKLTTKSKISPMFSSRNVRILHL